MCGPDLFKDIWNIKNPVLRQFAGVIGFIFTNAYLGHKYFFNPDYKHQFKIKLANQMIFFKESEVRQHTRYTVLQPIINQATSNNEHKLVKLAEHKVRKKLRCYYCKHQRPGGPRVLTSYYCVLCGRDKPLCSMLSGRDCFDKHITAMPSKKYRASVNQ